MANYRFKTAEIEAMKKNILTHCKYEREPDRHGNKSAWRLRLVLEGYVMCCRCSKREEARRLRELALYEKLTENDLPNWQDEPTQPATPTEMPQVSTETDGRVNVSAEEEIAAEVKRMVAMIRPYKNIDKYALTGHYTKLLGAVCLIFGIRREEAREKYGLFTYRQWYSLLTNITTASPQSPGTPQTVERTADPPKPRETARKPQNRGIGNTRYSRLGANGYAMLDDASATLAAMSVPRECSTADAAYW